MAYTKLFNSIVTSTIWMESDQARIVWITMLAIADKNGEVQASIPGLARVAGVSVEDCRTAMAKFLSPDLDSRTKDDEGRRIEEIEGGWSLLNYRKYREMASKEDSQAAEAKRKARYRAKLARNVPKCPTPVPPTSTVDPHMAEAEADKQIGERERVTPVTQTNENVTHGTRTEPIKPGPAKSPARALLKSFLLDTKDEAIEEWKILANRDAGCTTALEILEFLKYAITTARKLERQVAYARHCLPEAGTWKSGLRTMKGYK